MPGAVETEMAAENETVIELDKKVLTAGANVAHKMPGKRGVSTAELDPFEQASV